MSKLTETNALYQPDQDSRLSICLHFALYALLYAQNLAMGCFKMQPFYSVLQLTNVSQEIWLVCPLSLYDADD